MERQKVGFGWTFRWQSGTAVKFKTLYEHILPEELPHYMADIMQVVRDRYSHLSKVVFLHGDQGETDYAILGRYITLRDANEYLCQCGVCSLRQEDWEMLGNKAKAQRTADAIKGKTAHQVAYLTEKYREEDRKSRDGTPRQRWRAGIERRRLGIRIDNIQRRGW